MNLSRFDFLKVCGYVATFGSGLISLLPTTGLFPANQLTHISGILSLIVGIATLIANTFKNRTPADGTRNAVIPDGTIPVVGTPKDFSGPQVAHLVTSQATVAPLIKDNQ